MKFPETLGAAVDQLYQMRQDRLAKQKEVDKLGDEESLLREHVIKRFGKSKLNGAKGKLANCSVERVVVPTVKDFDQFMDWVEKNDARDMLTRSVNAKAYRERFDKKVVVAGIEPLQVTKLHLNKVRGAKS